MYPKKNFKCSICEKEYDKAVDRANCEIACSKRLEEEAKKAVEAKKQAEQAARKAKVDEAYEAAEKLREEYIKDYGTYVRTNIKLTNALDEHGWPTVGDIFKIFM